MSVIEAAPQKAPDAADNAEELPSRKLRRELGRQAVAMQRRGETAMAPEVMQEDVSFYTSHERFAREQTKIFRETPLVACFSAELPEPGSFRTFDDTGIPMFVTRGKDGKVRAFMNVCPHRGSRVVREECGKASRFTCRFHGWTYDATGKAIGIPDEGQFGDAISDQKKLTECPAEERHGLVFVIATPGATMDLDAFLGDFGEQLEMIDFDNAVPVHLTDLPVTANWKYGLDTFFETYHLNSLHKDTFRGLFSPVCMFHTFNQHHRYTFTPLVVDEWAKTPEDTWKIDLLPLQFFLYPNMLIAVGSTSPKGSTVNIHRIFPQSADYFVSKMRFCTMGGVQSPEHQAEIDASYKVARTALVEDDYSVAGESHAGLQAMAPGTKMPIGRKEIGVQNFHRNVRDAVGG